MFLGRNPDESIWNVMHYNVRWCKCQHDCTILSLGQFIGLSPLRPDTAWVDLQLLLRSITAIPLLSLYIYMYIPQIFMAGTPMLQRLSCWINHTFHVKSPNLAKRSSPMPNCLSCKHKHEWIMATPSVKCLKCKIHDNSIICTRSSPFTEETFLQMEFCFRGCRFKQVAHSDVNILCSFYLIWSLIILCGKQAAVVSCHLPVLFLLLRIIPYHNIIIFK